MFEKKVDRLRETSDEIGNIRGGGKTGFGRKPRLEKWTVGGTRPSSDRGVTFHFKHGFVTKGRHVSKSGDGETPAGSHQVYMERRTAVETLGDGREVPDSIPAERLGDENFGNDGELSTDDFLQPPTMRVAGLASFGNIGGDRGEREAFWRKVEEAESRNGRVQCRIICEIPHELDQGARIAIARDFCRVFEEYGLPFWCVAHAPDAKNDSRNNHLHIVYYDRPSRVAANGTWNFSYETTNVDAHRRKRTTRPFMANKDRDAQGKQWITQLRRRLADVANYHLAVAGETKRYDPRPYKESGVSKEPTRHLGTKPSAAERQGLATASGLENVRREMAFRVASGDVRFAAAERRISAIERSLSEISKKEKSGPKVAASAHGLVENEVTTHDGKRAEIIDWRGAAFEARELCEEGMAVSRRRELHLIAKDALTLRLATRDRWVKRESGRLYAMAGGKEPDGVMERADALVAERLLLDRTDADLARFVDGCDRVAEAQERRLSWIAIRQKTLVETLLRAEISLLEGTGLSPREAAAELERRELIRAMEEEALADASSQASNAFVPPEDDDDPSADVHDDADDGVAMPKGSEVAETSNGDGDVDEKEKPGIDDAIGEPPHAAPLSEAEVTEGLAGFVEEIAAAVGKDAATPNGRREKTYPLFDFLSLKESEKDAIERSGKSAAGNAPAASTPPANAESRAAETRAERGETKKTKGSVTPSPEDAAVAAMLGSSGAGRKKEHFAGAMTLEDLSSESVSRLEKEIAPMSNVEFRRSAFATRDASDLAADDGVRLGHKAAWSVMKDVAKRRGLDLDTGIHRPETATDRELAGAHTDSDASVPIDVRTEERKRRLRERETARDERT